MLTTENRRNEIYNLIAKNKKVKISDFKETYGISGVAIRNDLIYLENKGLIERTFGYAVLKEDLMKNIFDENLIKNINEKRKIGEHAVSLINENDSIMIYTGSTALQIAKRLNNFKNLIAVTNSIITAYELGKYPNIKTILLGGYYNPETNAVFGQQAIDQLKEYKLDKLFLTVDGISSSDGITSEHPFETEINKAMIEKAKEVIVIADFSKIGTSRFVKIASLDDVDILITDSKAPGDELKKIEEKGVKIVVV